MVPGYRSCSISRVLFLTFLEHYSQVSDSYILGVWVLFLTTIRKVLWVSFQKPDYIKEQFCLENILNSWHLSDSDPCSVLPFRLSRLKGSPVPLLAPLELADVCYLQLLFGQLQVLLIFLQPVLLAVIWVPCSALSIVRFKQISTLFPGNSKGNIIIQRVVESSLS
jgi:hypothetical protein